MQISGIKNVSSNDTSFGAKVKINPSKKILSHSESGFLEDIARNIGTKKDTVFFEVGKIQKEEGREMTQDGVDIFNIFSRKIEASFNLNGKNSKIQNLSKYDSYKTYAEELPENNILNRPFEYMSQYIEKLNKKYEALFNKPVL